MNKIKEKQIYDIEKLPELAKKLNIESISSFENDIQTKKIPLNCEIKVIKNTPISIHISSACDLEIYRKLDIYCEIDTIPTDSINHPLEKRKNSFTNLLKQLIHHIILKI